VSLEIEYHELVDLDLLEAWTWYEDQEDGLGERFLSAILAAIVRSSRWPNAGTPVLRDREDEIIERKVPADGFPYAIRYRIIGDRLVVMAVVHQNRYPNVGSDRRPD
jgi:plasmid stabilization system protein ParE